MRGFRCHPVYTHAQSRLNVVPLFASRAQALRLDLLTTYIKGIITTLTNYTKRKVKTLIALCAFALFRYLSVRWAIDLSKVVVLVGERGDTDYEDLITGLHKTLILRGSVEYGSEKLIRSDDSFKAEDVVPQHSPNITFSEGCEADDISTALESVGIK